MLLPNAEHAEVDIRKLKDYCLNPNHPEGKHKARLFESALGMTAEDALMLREAVLFAVKTRDARLGLLDEYGQRYTIDFEIEVRDRIAILRSGWIIEHGSIAPRLTRATHLTRFAVNGEIKLLDVVALTVDLPEHSLSRGQVGTVVEFLDNGSAYEVEFSDRDGRTYKSLGLLPNQFLVLRYEPETDLTEPVTA